MNELNAVLSASKAYKRLLGDRSGQSCVTGAADGLKPLIVSRLCSEQNKKGIIVCQNEIRAREFYDRLSLVCKNVYLYPAKDIVFYSADIKSADIVKRRFEVLSAVFKGEADFIVLSVESLFDRLVFPEVLNKNIIRLAEGDEIDIEGLASKLVFMGYERCAQVEGAGQFSVRGGIIDIFSPNNIHPIRVELWGDEIDTIRTVDNFSQRSLERIKEFEIYPFRELVFSDKEYKRALSLIEKESKTVFEKLKLYKSFGGIEKYINYFYEKTASIFDYIDPESIVFLDEYTKINADCEMVYDEFLRSVTESIESGKALKGEAEIVYSPEEIWQNVASFKRVYLSEFLDLEGEHEVIDFHSKARKGFGRDMHSLGEEIRGYFARKKTVILFASSTQAIKNIVSGLTEEGLSAQSGESPRARVVNIYRGALPSFEDDSCVVLNESGNTGRLRKKRRKAYKDTARITGFSDLKPGDYVVHENHGIGVYKGISQVETDGLVKDYLCLEYAKGGKIYVSVNQMELVQKYIGGDVSKIKLNSLGGASWARAKAKARTAVKKLTFDLAELYGKRQFKSGYVYSTDTVWQKEFEEAFPYEETEDQLAAINDVKRDMEAGKIMDRLICGDVGYGKTEIALRAAFKAINDSKQAAFLVPTTILANQHYTNIKERFKDYPVTIEMLSRFRSKKEQTETIEGLKSGKVDFVIGTHRLLSADIEFKDLGLVIVDEEQRFGVGHKEKLKRMTENVDVLTLSATPIPRTLHMSLSGIRDMSILNEPPEDRLPVQTYVMEYSEETVRTAILRELARGGQVYYLHNRVQSIDEVAERLGEILPEAKIGVGHGQMNERSLENVLTSFIEKEINVLVCTTIIETGMDIQNVNTIIVEDSDFMGLSQLYQLRGRVGRSDRQAYAYFMYKKNKIPNDVSEKRLRAIKEFTEFGSGFKIALRDLEIRGAGDLLGASQHGHMDKIGYDLYCKILEKAVRELRGEKEEEIFETLVDLKVNAFIPSTYIDDEVQKLEMYKKISLIMSEKDMDEVGDELTDRFGDYPKVVENLMKIAILKQMAHKLKMVSVIQREDSVVLTYKQDAEADTEKLFDLIREKSGNMQITTASAGTYLTYKTDVSGSGIIDEIINVLNKLG